MPTPPAVPEVIRFRLTGQLRNLAAWGNRIYVLYTGSTPGPADILAFCEGIAAAWGTDIAGLCSEYTYLLSVDGVDLSSDLGSNATADVDTPGTVDVDSVDNQIAATVRFDISRRYRGGKPKLFHPGAPINAVLDGSHWTTTFVNNVGTKYGDFNTAIQALSSGGCDLQGIVNVSLYKGFTSVENPITHRYRDVPTYRGAPQIDLVSSFTCDPVMGSQKRRRLA